MFHNKALQNIGPLNLFTRKKHLGTMLGKEL